MFSFVCSLWFKSLEVFILQKTWNSQTDRQKEFKEKEENIHRINKEKMKQETKKSFKSEQMLLFPHFTRL